MHRVITELDAAWLRIIGLLASPRGERNGKECFWNRRAVVRAFFELEDKRRQVGLPALDQMALGRDFVSASCDTPNQAALLVRVRTLCTETDGKRGIWKRVDENRELLEFLQEHAPALLDRFPFIEIWIGNQDIFLINLLRLLELPESPLALGVRFPRRWPGAPCIEGAYMDFTPAVAAMMDLPVAETPNGKDVAP